jgi:hypothetical protein
METGASGILELALQLSYTCFYTETQRTYTEAASLGVAFKGIYETGEQIMDFLRCSVPLLVGGS